MKCIVLLTCIFVSGCASLSNRPTREMVEDELAREKKLVVFVSSLSPAVIEERTLKSGCGVESTQYSNLFPVGAQTYAPVSSGYDFSVDHGMWPDGSRWIALRLDGVFHSVASGAKLVARADGGSDVTVFAADRRKFNLIKYTVEDGRLFCYWRDFDYPYD
jgi:hypothetical protein